MVYRLNKSILIAITGIISFLLALLFLDNEIIAGFTSLLAILLFVIAFRLAQNKKQLITVALLMSLGHIIRFLTLFDTYYILIAIIYICFLLYSLFILFGFILEKKIKTPFLRIFIFPIFYTISAIIVVLLKIGNLQNFTTYFMCIPYISLNLSLIGEFGMTFIVSLLLSLLAELLITNKKNRIIYLVSIITIVIALLVSGCILKTKISDKPDFYLNVALATCEKQDFLGNTDFEYSVEDYDNIFINAVKKAAEEHADLLVTNEEFCTFEYNKEQKLNEYALTAKQYKIPILICSETFVEGKEKIINDVAFVDENGNIITSYIKSNLVPFVEAGYFEAGDGNPAYFTHTFNNHEVNISIAICFDINNSFIINKMNDDTELLIVPSWNWDTCNIEQKRTRIRSIEKNVVILNHTYEGFTYISGPNGLIGDYVDNRNQYEIVKFIDVPIWGELPLN